MLATIHPSDIRGTIQAPASKSSMQRACACALLRKGKTILHNPGVSNDDQAARRVLSLMGARLQNTPEGSLEITGSGIHPAGSAVNCGESGLGIRMFTPILALSDQQIILEGEGSLLNRPLDFFDKILPGLGVKITSNGGKLPLVLQGPLHPENITIDGSLSSQFLTGLLLAYAASDARDITLTVTDLKSRPYIDLTLKVMGDFGLKVPENLNYQKFYFSRTPAPEPLPLVEYTVEGDWSGGAFLLVAGAISGSVLVKGLDPLSTQADKKILLALHDCGAVLEEIPGGISISSGKLQSFQFDADNCPDLFPPLVALAAYCKGVSVIEGVQRLTHKESNRALTLQEEFGKMGVEVRLEDNRMLVTGTGLIKGAAVHSHHDHRIAMACAVAGLKASGNTIIEEAEAVNKSYPNFYEDLCRLGVSLALNNQFLHT